MHNTFLTSYPDGKSEVIRARMLDFGSVDTEAAVSRTMALTAAIGVWEILEGKIYVKGFHSPVIPEILKLTIWF